MNKSKTQSATVATYARVSITEALTELYLFIKNSSFLKRYSVQNEEAIHS